MGMDFSLKPKSLWVKNGIIMQRTSSIELNYCNCKGPFLFCFWPYHTEQRLCHQSESSKNAKRGRNFLIFPFPTVGSMKKSFGVANLCFFWCNKMQILWILFSGFSQGT